MRAALPPQRPLRPCLLPLLPSSLRRRGPARNPSPAPHPADSARRRIPPLPEDSIVRHYEAVSDAFAKGTVEEIEAALAEAAGRLGEGSPEGRLCGALLAELRKGSPTTLKARAGACAKRCALCPPRRELSRSPSVPCAV